MKKILKNTWAILSEKERQRLILLGLLDIIISIADILSLALLLWIIRFYIQPDAGQNLSFLPTWLADRHSIWFIALFFLFFGIKNILAWMVSNARYRYISRVAVRISGINLSQYQHAGFTEFVNTDSAVHIRKIGFQPFEFSQYVLAGIPQILTQGTLILLTVIAITLFNAKLFLLLLALLLPPVILIFYLIRKRLARARKEIKTGNEKSFQYLLDALQGYVESNIYDRNQFFLDRFTKSREKFSAAIFKSISIQEMPARVIELFAVLGLFILIAIAKWTGTHNTNYLVTVGAFLGAAYKIIPGIVKIINISGQIIAYEFSITDLVDKGQQFLKEKEKEQETGLDSIELRNIHFQYDQEPLLNDFSLSVQKGDFIGISGDSGKGKTTILHLLLGFLPARAGEIRVNGKARSQFDLPCFWPSVAYVRQQSFFIHDSILRNITLQENDPDPGNFNFATEASGLNKFFEASPEGPGKMITENGKNISGGQRQRIALARAFYKDASLLILDEPFSELDEESELLLLEQLQQLARKGKMILLVTHSKRSLSFCNKTVTL